MSNPMKSKVGILIFSFAAASVVSGQGVVTFLNNTDTLSSPPDRLVRFAAADTPGNVFGTNNAPAVGTNFLVQLYYGASTSSEGSLTAVTAEAAILRASTTVQPGTWARGGNRTLQGFDFGETVLLQVRVWDYFSGATYEEAVLNNPSGVSGKSMPFTFFIDPGQPPVLLTMFNFRGFTLQVPEPSSSCLFIGVC